MNTYEATPQNKTLFQVLQDNIKILERRIIPLLEAFLQETKYFSELQSYCLRVAKNIPLQPVQLSKVKVSKKSQIGFEKEYKPISEQDIQAFILELQVLLKCSQDLKQDLTKVQLVKSLNQKREEKRGGVFGTSQNFGILIKEEGSNNQMGDKCFGSIQYGEDRPILIEDEELFEDPDEKLFAGLGEE